MNTPNSVLMRQARETLSPKWGLVIGTFFVYSFISGAASYIPLGSLILVGPLTLGITIFSLNFSRNKNPEMSQIFDGFHNFGTSLIAFLLETLFVGLWTLLFVIPGIIASLSYSQVFYIIADEPKIDAMEALRKSQRMMKGKKWKLFCLGLRFIGWFLLSILTLGIGLLWLIPYVQVSYAKFYDDVKEIQPVTA